MLKGKNLWYVVGIGAVAYYFWWMNKKNQAAKVVSAPAYENANGDTTRKKSDTTISGSSPFKHVVLKGNKPKN